MGHTAGALREATFGDLTFRVIADAAAGVQNIREKYERIHTRQGSYQKVVLQPCYFENLKLETSAVEYQLLKELNAKGEDIKGTLTLADGSMYKGLGSFAEIGPLDTGDGTCTVKFEAVTDFVLFAASA